MMMMMIVMMRTVGHTDRLNSRWTLPSCPPDSTAHTNTGSPTQRAIKRHTYKTAPLLLVLQCCREIIALLMQELNCWHHWYWDAHRRGTHQEHRRQLIQLLYFKICHLKVCTTNKYHPHTPTAIQLFRTVCTILASQYSKDHHADAQAGWLTRQYTKCH